MYDSTFLTFILEMIFHCFDFLFFSVLFLPFVCLFIFFSFGLSEDDAYVEKLPTFERHFDSFAGIVTIPSRRGKGTRWGMGWGNCSCVSFQCV